VTFKIACLKIYNVKSANNFLLSTNGNITPKINNIIEHKEVPLKVSIFEWHVLPNRILTIDNLIRRG